MTEPSSVSGADRGSVALVTGASRGIGRAIAGEVSRWHRDTIVVARSQEALRDAAEEGLCAHVVAADLSDPAEVARLAAYVVHRFDRLDLLVHSAGVFQSGTGVSDDLMAINFHAPVQLTTRLLPLLKAAKGQVVFINSTQGQNAGRDAGAYAASKFALRAFADSFRAEVNADGIRVLTVFAGTTATAMQEQIHERAGRPYQPERLMQPADIAAMVAAALRVPRTAEVTEITIRPMLPPVTGKRGEVETRSV